MASRSLLHFPRATRTLSAPTSHYLFQPRLFGTSLARPERSPEGGDQNPQRDAQQDREKINTDSNEYAKSGTDDTTAKNEEAAFDPNITSPEGARQKAGEGNKMNPLDVSPANPKVSEGTAENGGGAKEKGSL